MQLVPAAVSSYIGEAERVAQRAVSRGKRAQPARLELELRIVVQGTRAGQSESALAAALVLVIKREDIN